MRAPVALLVVAALVRPLAVGAQDVAVSRVAGLRPPAVYDQQLRADPTAYSFGRALFARVDPGRAPTQGSVRLPVVLALFVDSQTPTVSQAMVQASLFDGPAPHGTLTEAYLEMSRGALTVGGDVFPWVRTGLTMSEVVGASSGLGNDGLLGAWLAEALDSLDAVVDFRPYDNDGPDGIADSGDDDGYVDLVTFEFLEIAGHCGGPAIWPHRWTLRARNGAAYVTDDVGAGGGPLRIDDYVTQGVTDCTGTEVQDASVMAHELGHALGLPDFYHWVDPAAGAYGRRWVLGCWALMAAGSWGCGPLEDPPGVFGPTHFMAYSKERVGWISYLGVGEVWNEEVWLDPVQSGGVALRVPMGASGTEFLLAEYRARVGFDAQLPAEGVLFYKLDTGASLAPSPSTNDPYRITLLEQDGDRGLLRTHAEGGDRGVAGDVWGVGGSVGPLHAGTVPALRLSDGRAWHVTVHEVEVVGGRARLVLSTSPTPRLVLPPGAAGLPVSLRVAGGTMPYAVVASVTPGVTLTPTGDAVLVSGLAPPQGDLVLSVRDAAGRSAAPVLLAGNGWSAWTPAASEVVAPLLDPSGPSPSPGQLDYLDQAGNRNGVYDVGDLRRWLREGPQG